MCGPVDADGAQAQGLLLVALQRNGSFRALGGDKPIPAKFRLVAATNQSRNILHEKLTADFLDRISDLVIEFFRSFATVEHRANRLGPA